MNVTLAATSSKALAAWEADPASSILQHPTLALWAIGPQPAVGIGHAAWTPCTGEALRALVIQDLGDAWKRSQAFVLPSAHDGCPLDWETGAPLPAYEGAVLVSLESGATWFQTWRADGKRHWRVPRTPQQR